MKKLVQLIFILSVLFISACIGGTDSTETKSSDASLVSLLLKDSLGSTITISPSFSSSVSDYTAETESSKITVIASPQHNKATLTGNGDHLLTLGKNEIIIKVTAEDLTTKIYTINITKKEISDTTPPIITLKGDSFITLFIGDKYTDSGASASDDVDGDISDKITVSGSVDTSKAGIYDLKYNVSDKSGNKAIELIRTITVSEKPTDPDGDIIYENGNIWAVSNNPSNPTVFTIDKPVLVKYMYTYHYFNYGALPGSISLQHEDGTIYGPWDTYGTVGQGDVPNAYWNVKPNVTIKAGKHTVIDSDPSTWSHNSDSGFAGFVLIKGFYQTLPSDTTPPIITLKGDSFITLFIGDKYTDSGASASDDVDGDISSKISVTGLPIDTSKIGSFYIKYNVSDKAGNKASEVVRTVVVKELIPVTYTLFINSDKTAILADGNDSAVLSGTIYDNLGNIVNKNNEIEYYANEIKLTNNIFKTTVSGTYSVKAKWNGYESSSLNILASEVNIDTITSTKIGGKWEDSSTWLGGIVPTENHNVIIDGDVNVEGTVSCKNLTVNNSAKFGNRYYVSNFTVKGNLLNNGQIYARDYGFNLTLNGDFVQNGTYTVSYTIVNGNNISTGEGAFLTGSFSLGDNKRILNVNSNLYINGINIDGKESSIDLNGGKVFVLGGRFTTSNLTILNSSELNMAENTVIDNSYFKNESIPIILSGFIRGEGQTIFDSSVVIAKSSSMANYYYEWRVNITKNFENNGSAYKQHYGFSLTIGGDFTQNGDYDISTTDFKGVGIQNIATATGKTLKGPFTSTGTASFKALSSINTSTFYFNANGKDIDMNGFYLNILESSFETVGGTFKNIAGINCSPNTLIRSSSFENTGTITLMGEIKGEGNTTFTGNVKTESLSVFANSYYQWIVEIKGNFTNYGNTYTQNYGFILNISGDFAQYKDYSVASTSFNGTTIQNISCEKDTFINGTFYIEKTSPGLKAISALNFKSFKIEAPETAIIDMNQYGVYLDSGTFEMSGGKITNIKSITGTENSTVINSYFANALYDIELYGIVKGEGSTIFDSSVSINNAASMYNQYYQWTVNISNTFFNYGSVSKQHYGLIVKVGGNFEQAGDYNVSETYFTGDAEQHISTPDKGYLLGAFIFSNPNKTAVAGSNINVQNCLISFAENSKNVFDINGNSINIIVGSFEVKNATVSNTVSINANTAEGVSTILYNTEFSSSSIHLQGKIRGEGNTKFFGDVTLDTDATLYNNYYVWNIDISGTFTNYGTVGGQHYGLKINGVSQ